MSAKNDATEVCVDSVGEFKKKFASLKKFYNIQNGAELVNVLVLSGLGNLTCVQRRLS